MLLAALLSVLLIGCALPRDVPPTADAQRSPLLERFGRDQATLNALGRVPQIRSGFDWARAQCFVQHAYSELHGRDRAGFTDAALTQAEGLLAALQSGRPGGPTALINHRERMRPDLWATAERTRGNACAAATAGCLEVQLVRAGHEYHRMGWRHATSYFAIAEDMAQQAAREAAACPPPPVLAAPPPPAPMPATPLPPPSAAATSPLPDIQRATLTLSADVLFQFNRHGAEQLLDEGRRQLDAAADKLKAVDLIGVQLTGHTDPEGSDAYNERLSLQRAETVKALLVARGVPAKKIATAGRGEREPVVQCDRRTLRGELLNRCNQPNRRVVIDFRYRQ